MVLALIDADIIVYEAAYSCQSGVEWEPGEWTHHASFPEGQQVFAHTVTNIMKQTGADQAILSLTDKARDENFRRDFWPEYKAHREGVGNSRPLLYGALREWCIEDYDVIMKPRIEADDTIGILATGHINGLPPVEDRVICSVDKDLDTVPGKHFNWRKPELGVYDVSDFEAFYNHMLQTMTGDRVDNFPGIPQIGAVRAARMLEGLDSKSAMWQTVVEAFSKKDLSIDDALAQARCARILQADNWDFVKNEVVLWMPPAEDSE